MRASILALGPLLARCGEARVSLPGGCAIGLRPVDQHVKGLQAMGAEIDLEHGYINARAARLKGARFVFDVVTVTGTENLMMAATLAEGTTILENAAREPEVVDLAHCLDRDGRAASPAPAPTASSSRASTRLHGATHAIMPDRIETGTFLAAVGGDRRRRRRSAAPRRNARRGDRQAARSGRRHRDRPRRRSACAARAGRCAPSNVRTAPYPGFPTDMQAQFMALAALRRRHVGDHRDDLREPDDARAGAASAGRRHRRRGQHRGRPRASPKLTGANVMATDLRASACLVIAGLVAEGRDDDRPHLSPRPRLRAHRGEAVRARRAHHAASMTSADIGAGRAARRAARACDRSIPTRYDAVAALPVAARAAARARSASRDRLPFRGVDLWTAYELSWLDERGKPQVAIASFAVPVESPSIVESKSVKLYLGSFAQTRYARAADRRRRRSSATCPRRPVRRWPWRCTAPGGLRRADDPRSSPARCLDGLPVACDAYDVDPALLAANGRCRRRDAAHRPVPVGVPGDRPARLSRRVQIAYRGPRIDRAALLRYLVSYRCHAGFHEHCVERIFVDVAARCGCEALTVLRALHAPRRPRHQPVSHQRGRAARRRTCAPPASSMAAAAVNAGDPRRALITFRGNPFVDGRCGASLRVRCDRRDGGRTHRRLRTRRRGGCASASGNECQAPTPTR